MVLWIPLTWNSGIKQISGPSKVSSNERYRMTMHVLDSLDKKIEVLYNKIRQDKTQQYSHLEGL